MMDTEMENCQGDSKGLKKNQTADKHSAKGKSDLM